MPDTMTEQRTRSAKRQRVTFWLDHDHVRALTAIKEQCGLSKAEQLRRAMTRWITACRRTEKPADGAASTERGPQSAANAQESRRETGHE